MTEKFISSELLRLNLCTSINKVKSVSGGCISNAACYSTDKGDFFVKTNTAKKASEWFVAESLALERMDKAVPGFVPKPIYHHEIKKDVTKTEGETAYIVTEYVPMSDNQRSPKVQKELGQQLAKLHASATTDFFGFDVTSFCGTTELNNAWSSNWSQFWKTQRMEPLLNQVKGQNRDIDQYGKEICSRIEHWLGQDVLSSIKPALLHGDLWNGNWAVHDGSPIIFDPASYYGHYEAEFGIMKMFGGFSRDCFDAYDDTMSSKYGTTVQDDGREERLILYEMYHHLNHYAMFGGSYGSGCLNLMEKLL